MKVWTVILAGVILAALPNLGNSALEDAGVVVANDYQEFEKRVLPVTAQGICVFNKDYKWFQINTFEQILLDFENGANAMNVKFSLGTPTVMFALVANEEFDNALYCKYLPKEFHNSTGLSSSKASLMMLDAPLEYYAVKINDMERATIMKGWNDLLKVVKNQFPNNKPSNYYRLIVEKTAAGVIYVGAIQNYK